MSKNTVDNLARASAGCETRKRTFERSLAGFTTVLPLLMECGRIETPAGQHRPHSILSVLR